jgi:hypothetical protein
MKNNIKKYSKLGVALIGAFLFSFIFSDGIFVNNSPIVRRDIPHYYALKFDKTAIGKVPFMAKLIYNFKYPSEKLQDLPLIPVARGVSAKEKGNVIYSQVNVGELKLIQYTFEVNGKQIKIRVPEGDTPPTQDELEKIYK